MMRVGSFPHAASPYDVLDQAGNAWEWTLDWYGAGYYTASPASNPPGPATGAQRVVRGGGMTSNELGVRIARRNYEEPAGSVNGFRCGRTQ